MTKIIMTTVCSHSGETEATLAQKLAPVWVRKQARAGEAAAVAVSAGKPTEGVWGGSLQRSGGGAVQLPGEVGAGPCACWLVFTRHGSQHRKVPVCPFLPSTRGEGGTSQ